MKNEEINEAINEILKKTPFNTYEDIFDSVRMKKADLKINVYDAIRIASINHHTTTKLMIFVPFILSIIPIIWYCIIVKSWWLLLILPINFIASFFINYFPKLHYLSYITIILHLIIELPTQLLGFALSLLIISLSNDVWWKITYTFAFNELEHNKEAFLWCWNRFGLRIVDSSGNNYYKKIKPQR